MTWAVLAGTWVVAIAVSPWRPVTTDEAWFLVVTRRLLHGERLYRDVFFGAGPLAPVVGAVACKILRPQLVVTRSVVAGYLAAGATAAYLSTRAIGASPSLSLLVAAGIALVAGPHVAPHNHYGHLTSATVVGAAAAITAQRPVVAGILVGIAIAGRYPVGVVGALALAPAVGSGIGAYSVAATATVALLYLPLGPDLGWFHRRAVMNKSTYVRAGRLGPTAWIRGVVRRRGTDLGSSIPSIVGLVVIGVAAVAAAAGAVVGIARADATILLGAGLATTALAATFPRFDAAHLVGAMPPAVTGVALLGLSLVGDVPVAVGAATCVVAGGVGYVATIRSTKSIQPELVRRDVPSLRYAPVVNRRGPWPDDTDCVRRHGDAMLVVRPDAPLVYATGGIVDPTPFDYPFSTTFGPTGQREVAERLEEGSITALVDWPDRDSPFTPSEILAATDALPEVAHCELGSIRRSNGA